MSGDRIGQETIEANGHTARALPGAGVRGRRGGADAPTTKYGERAGGLAKCAAVKAGVADAEGVEGRAFVIMWAIGMREEGRDEFSSTGALAVGTTAKRQAYRLQVEFRDYGPSTTRRRGRACRLSGRTLPASSGTIRPRSLLRCFRFIRKPSGARGIPAEVAKNKRDHRVYLASMEASLLREQLLARAARTTSSSRRPRRQWDRSRFGDRVWRKSVAAAARQMAR